ncbi:hypothetical protein C6Y40_23625 [Alteromonas alba]|uniref:Uncharacterized protein n=1 Tax=Alteromonas alba TaxID=2079529 RepID=A0A2S9V3V7_9ALTE|nr:hypothetical protein C6Y40_23625 [Alteromonas alba]
MKYLIVKSEIIAFYFFILPLLLFTIIGFIDTPPFVVFNFTIFAIVLIGLVLIHATYSYVIENHMEEVKESQPFMLLLPSTLVLFLICITLYYNYVI